MQKYLTWSSVRMLPVVILSLIVAAPAGGPALAQAGSGTLLPIVPGQRFPGEVYTDLNGRDAQKINLAHVLGKKPVMLYYWVATNMRAEQTFVQLQKLVEELGTERIALYGVAVPRPHLGPDQIRARIEALGIKVPVLEDTDFRLGTRLRVGTVPNLTIIDKGGTMRLTNGAALQQVLGYKVDLETAIRRTAETGSLMTYGYLDRYYPVRELEGQPCPDFSAPLLSTSKAQSYHGLLDDKKVNVLIFWSVDCPHCREYLPQISRWLDEHPEGLNVVSAANTASEAAVDKTREFCKTNKFSFPTLVDADSEIGRLFKITSTPTVVIIGPDGVVDSVILSNYTDFGETLEASKRRLLKSG